jgi:pimeloyl-ACP methyl ester carboxylesterase
MKTLIARLLGAYLNILSFIAPRYAGNKGFLLFCRPFRLQLSDKQKEFLNSAEKFAVDLEGQHVQAYKWGNGAKKVLFLHGWQSHSYRWKTYIEALSRDEYTIYSLDAPGHGMSAGNFLSVPVYGKLIHEFILDKGEMHAVVGHSLGSFSLLYSLHQYPLLPVRRLVLMAPPGEARDFMDFYKQTLGLSNRTLSLVINHFVEKYEVPPEYFSTTKFASSVAVSGLIIHDEEDDEAPYHYAPRIHEAWKKSKLITTKGFGHNLKSISVVKDVVDFIETPLHEPAYS